MKDELPWFRCFPSKWLGALAAMKQDEGYLYIIVCFRIYEVGGPCADTLDALVLRSHMNKRRVSDLLDKLFRAGKLIRTSTGIMNPFAAEVLAEMEQFRETRSRAGLRGAQQRWKKVSKNNKATMAQPCVCQ